MDQDFSLLVEASEFLQGEYKVGGPFDPEDPFAWVRSQSSGRRGAIGKKLVSTWLGKRGFRVTSAFGHRGEAHRLVNGFPVQIKSSTLWDGGSYQFQQLRKQEYKLLICLGINPSSAHCWVLTKDLIVAKWGQLDGIKPQHRGKAGSDTAWLQVDPRRPPSWLGKCGGRLADAFPVISDLVGRKS